MKTLKIRGRLKTTLDEGTFYSVENSKSTFEFNGWTMKKGQFIDIPNIDKYMGKNIEINITIKEVKKNV